MLFSIKDFTLKSLIFKKIILYYNWVIPEIVILRITMIIYKLFGLNDDAKGLSSY